MAGHTRKVCGSSGNTPSMMHPSSNWPCSPEIAQSHYPRLSSPRAEGYDLRRLTCTMIKRIPSAHRYCVSNFWLRPALFFTHRSGPAISQASRGSCPTFPRLIPFLQRAFKMGVAITGRR
jgi:hypothetical protein